jgi:hypothetical protein
MATIAGRRRGGVQVRRQRSAWSARRERLFLEKLAATCNVAASAETARLPVSTVYAHKRSDARFAEAWGEAIQQGYEQLELKLLERALNGVRKPIFHGGKQVSETTEFNDARALQLMRMHRDEVVAARNDDDADAERDQRELEEISERFAIMRERLTGGAEKAGADE